MSNEVAKTAEKKAKHIVITDMFVRLNLTIENLECFVIKVRDGEDPPVSDNQDYTCIPLATMLENVPSTIESFRDRIQQATNSLNELLF